jgi:hypothetical protein
VGARSIVRSVGKIAICSVLMAGGCLSALRYVHFEALGPVVWQAGRAGGNDFGVDRGVFGIGVGVSLRGIERGGHIAAAGGSGDGILNSGQELRGKC